MENLYTKATKYTFEIDLNANGALKLSGKSFPENTFEIYTPMMDWIKEYLASNAAPETIIDFNITYCNSSSTMLLFDLFDLFLENNDNNIVLNWYYDEENDSMEEIGEDIVDEFPDLNVNLILIK